MKWKAFMIMVLTIASLVASSPVGAQVTANRIHWAHSPERAMSLARDSHLPILAFVTSENCTYCRKMERETWSNPQIIAQTQAGFIPLKLHASQHRKLVAELGVRAFPSTILFTPEGNVINGAKGFLRPNQLAGLLHTAHPTKVALHPVE